MKKILAFAGSNSPTSINHQLLLAVTSQLQDLEVEVLVLRDYDFPMYSVDREKNGFPEVVTNLYTQIQDTSILIISVNEHNRMISAFFKNILDWLSRVDRKFLQAKRILLMSTSPGKRGGAAALDYCKKVFPRFGATIEQSFSLPLFYENFDTEAGKIKNEVFELGVLDVITSFNQQTKD